MTQNKINSGMAFPVIVNWKLCLILVLVSYIFGGLIAKGGDTNLNLAYAGYLTTLAEFMKTVIANGKSSFIFPISSIHCANSLPYLRYQLRYGKPLKFKHQIIVFVIIVDGIILVSSAAIVVYKAGGRLFKGYRKLLSKSYRFGKSFSLKKMIRKRKKYKRSRIMIWNIN